MDGDPISAPSAEHVRSSSWGGPEAGAELRRIADEARLRAGFEVSSIDVLRADGFLEVVAFSGRREDASMGGSFSLAVAQRVLREGIGYGKFVFLPEEEMAPDLQEAIRDYGYVPPLPETDDPRRWRSLDMLTAHLTDDSGRTRALLHLDEPVDGYRPTPERLAEIAVDLEQLLQAAVTTVDREELTRHVRLDETAREVVRAASLRLGRRDLLDVVNPRLVAGFRASAVRVQLYDDPADESDPGAPPADLLAALGAATRRAWDSRTVIVVEPDHVWGDDKLDREHREGLGRYLGEQSARELLLVPVGAGFEAMGMLVVVRDARDRWTESESAAALGVGHDLGRALLSTRAHEREQQLIGELQRLDEYRRQLIATVAHEFKNPLGVIVGHVEMLEQLPGLPQLANTSISAMGRSSTRLNVLVDDLLLLSRMGNTDTPLSQLPVDLVPVLAEVVEDESGRAEQQQVTIRTAVCDDAMIVTGDPELLFRLCSNLANNAVKYSQPGGVVDLSLERVGDEVVFTCTDDGLGISEADREQLFSEFFRSTNPEALGRPGTGLGLAIVERIVSRHDGRIEVSSTLGSGTTFRVKLRVWPWEAEDPDLG